MRIVCFLLPAFFLLAACDPARRIEMKNQSNDTAQVVWKSKKDSIGFNPFVLNNSNELRFVIPPHKNSQVKLSFGMGSWTPEEVTKAIHRLDYFEIITPSQNLKIDSLPRLRDYLLARRKGIGSARIEIVIE